MALQAPLEAVPVRTAVRFPLRLEVVLSTPEGECAGLTENVSANGMLFISNHVPEIGTEVQFRLTMPAAVMGGRENVTLHCLGRVVRHGMSEGRTSAAVVIDEYSLRAE